jgi:LCP family protein required for cell wall assembly
VRGARHEADRSSGARERAQDRYRPGAIDAGSSGAGSFDASSPDAGRMPDAAPAKRRRRRHRVLIRTAWTLAGLLVLTGAVGVAAALKLKGNIQAVDVTRNLGTDRPTAAPSDPAGDRPLNVLVLGSDSREGANGFVGGKVDEGRSDTTLVLHLSADRSRALAVSIPRDSVVTMPTCVDRTGGTSPAAERQFNDAYTIGGVACTQRTVEQLTGLRIDHYVVVDFAGFKDMVDALGTVPICLPKPVNDTRHHITLPAGRSRVNGTQALAYVRERYALGDGGDLGRIDRQQAFLASVLQEAISAGTLTNPPRLYAFLSAATRSVTMDPALAGFGALTSLAKQVADIGLGHIQFVTVPNEPYEPDPNRLQWAASARQLWRAIRLDAPVSFGPRAGGTATGGGSPSGGSTAAPVAGDIDPATVRVRVLNAAGTPGAGKTASDQLSQAGWNVVGVADADRTGQTRTRIVYGSGSLAAARADALAAVLPGAELVSRPGSGTTLQLEVGTDWAGVQAAASPTSGSGSAGSAAAPVVVSGAQSRTAATDICSA